MRLFLLLVLVQHPLERLEPAALGYPALPVHFEILLAVVHDLLLRPNRAVESLQEVLVILPLGSADTRP